MVQLQIFTQIVSHENALCEAQLRRIRPAVITPQIVNSHSAAFATETPLSLDNPTASTPMYQRVITFTAESSRCTGLAALGSEMSSAGPGVARTLPITTANNVEMTPPKTRIIAANPQTSTPCI